MVNLNSRNAAMCNLVRCLESNGWRLDATTKSQSFSGACAIGVSDMIDVLEEHSVIDFVNTRFQMAHFTIGPLSKGVKRIGTKGTRKIFSDAPLHCAPALICAAPSPFFSFALEWTWYRYVHQIPRVCINTGYMDDNATGGVGLTWLHEVQQLIHSFYTAAKYSLIRVIWFGLELNGHPPCLISKRGPPSFMASPPFGRPTR